MFGEKSRKIKELEEKAASLEKDLSFFAHEIMESFYRECGENIRKARSKNKAGGAALDTRNIYNEVLMKINTDFHRIFGHDQTRAQDVLWHFYIVWRDKGINLGIFGEPPRIEEIKKL